MDSTSTDVRRRPDLWSYISFSRPSSRGASSSAPSPLPLQNNVNGDPFKGTEWGAQSRAFSAAGEGSLGGPARMSHGQRIRFFKYGAVIGVLLLLFYFFSPKKYIQDFSSSHGFTGSSNDAKTTSQKCTKPHDSSKPLIQYALMIDAGSTGSRIHAYRFNNCGPTPELENEMFKQTEKKEGGSGLSSYDSDAVGAAKSLDVLLDEAVRIVPKDQQSCTPIAVKATAGLRKLGEEKSERILAAVRERLEKSYPFPVVSKERGGVEVMNGTDEGVYAWITTNYLLGRIGSAERNPTAAIFDLGGGSTQIVFEPTFPKPAGGGAEETLSEGEHKYNLTFGGRDFTLYQHSYLGYGLMAAREKLHKAVLENAAESNQKSSDRKWLDEPVVNPCIAPGQSRLVDVELEAGHPLFTSSSASPSDESRKLSVNMTGPSAESGGSPAQCRGLAEKTLHKGEKCKMAPCAFAGVHQPALSKVFSHEDIFLFSYFYDRTQPLGMPESFSLSELKSLTAKVCQGESAWSEFESVGVKGVDAVEELKGRPETCLDLNFMLALLLTGYEMPLEREVRIAKKIKEKELGWCLGASLPLLEQESGWTCRVKEVS